MPSAYDEDGRLKVTSRLETESQADLLIFASAESGGPAIPTFKSLTRPFLPAVDRLYESGDPQVLTIDAIPDGFLFQRVGTTIIGLDPATIEGAGSWGGDYSEGAASSTRSATIPAGDLVGLLHFGARGLHLGGTLTLSVGGEDIDLGLATSGEADSWEIRGEIKRISTTSLAVYATLLWRGQDASSGSNPEVLPNPRETISVVDVDANDTVVTVSMTNCVQLVWVGPTSGGGSGSGSGGGTPNEGVSPLFSPMVLTHVDSKYVSGLTLDVSDFVDVWKDLNLRIRDFGQTLTKRPLYLADTGDGLPGVQFDGVNDLVVHPSSGPGQQTGEWWAVVTFDVISGSAAYTVIGSWDDGTAALVGMSFGAWLNSGDARIWVYQRNNDTADNFIGSTPLSAGVRYVLRWMSDGTTTRMFVNGVEETLTILSGANTGDWFADSASIGRDNMTIGGAKWSSEADFAPITVHEVFCIDVGYFHEEQAMAVTARLNSKWNLGL